MIRGGLKGPFELALSVAPDPCDVLLFCCRLSVWLPALGTELPSCFGLCAPVCLSRRIFFLYCKRVSSILRIYFMMLLLRSCCLRSSSSSERILFIASSLSFVPRPTSND